jgi:hypothetical protein
VQEHIQDVKVVTVQTNIVVFIFGHRCLFCVK